MMPLPLTVHPDEQVGRVRKRRISRVPVTPPSLRCQASLALVEVLRTSLVLSHKKKEKSDLLFRIASCQGNVEEHFGGAAAAA